MVDTTMTSVMTDLIAWFEAIAELVNQGYGNIPQTDAANMENDVVTAQLTWLQNDFCLERADCMVGSRTDGTWQNIVQHGAACGCARESRKIRIWGFVHRPRRPGYVAMMHGNEMVVSPKSQVPARMSGGFDDPEIKNLLTALVTQGAKRQNVSLVLENGRELRGYIQATADELDQNGIDR